MHFKDTVPLLLMMAICYAELKLHNVHIQDIIEKRSVTPILKGIEALKTVVSGAIRLRSQSQRYRRYEKRGDIKTAYEDFYATSPENILQEKRNGELWWTGTVGDREIILRDPIDISRNPYIEIVDTKSKRKLRPGEWKLKGQYADRVIYKEKGSRE